MGKQGILPGKEPFLYFLYKKNNKPLFLLYNLSARK